MRSVRPPAPAVPAASAAPVEPEEGDESGGPSISISFVKNRGRLGALSGLDGWVAGSAQTPFPAAVPGQLGLSLPVRREAAAAGGLRAPATGGAALGGCTPELLSGPPGTLRTGAQIAAPQGFDSVTPSLL